MTGTEKRLIDANILETAFKNAKRSCKTDLLKSIYSLALKAVNDCPTVDAVSRGVHEQVRWERDVAIEQLESYGVSLGGKAEVAKVVHGRWIDEFDGKYAKQYDREQYEKGYQDAIRG